MGEGRAAPEVDLILWASIALAAAPFRGELPRPADVRWVEGRRHDALVVAMEDDGPPGPGFRRLYPGHDGALARWWIVEDPDAASLGARLLADPRVATAYLPSLPAPPPADIPPETPDFTGEQGWLLPEIGISAGELARWRDDAGAGVAIADLEYGWEPQHEDLESTREAGAWGTNRNLYTFHGTSVLGQLVGGDNGYGVVGVVPGATPLVLSPYDESDSYDLGAAILASLDLLGPGDVLLIEQQAYCPDGVGYCPVEVDDAVFDAIAAVVAAGIVVVEPAANGARDLDDPAFFGRFDRTQRDSGAIIVGGGASPESGLPPRSWFPYGSDYGSRVDVQGWYDRIATTTSGDYNGAYADLWYPDDTRQGYTATFGGTSGASPMVTGVVAAAQAIALAEWGEPWEPLALRAALVSTGSPQQGDLAHLVGPLPDLRRLVRTYVR